MDIRRATEADAEALSALNADIQGMHARALPTQFKPPSADTFPPDKIRSLLAYPQVRMWICRVDGKPAGYAYAEVIRQGETAMRPATEFVYLHHLSVAPAYRRRGYGAALLRAVLDLAAAEQIAAVQLDVWAFNAEAQGFFARHGFAPFTVRMWRNGPVE